jgi:predicted DCC family thiol-disulfide oxidoreductase YuxK
MTDEGRPIGWVLYDDSCGFCRRWVPFWANTLRKRGFAIAPLQSEWVVQALSVPREDLLFDLRLLLADGEQVRGADVYRHVIRRIWWAYPLYLLSVAPLLRLVFDWAYRTFANNRHRVSRACRLPAADDGAGPVRRAP